MKPKETIEGFDEFLDERGLTLEAVVIGGAALGLLGFISRQTRDCDILHPELPAVIQEAARQFAELRGQQGDVLAEDWLNNGPSSLTDVLPAGWIDRLQLAYEGKTIILHSLGRLDLLRSKIFALCDRGIDLSDCIALAPTAAELDELLPWLQKQDANPDWPNHVRSIIEDLKARLKNGV